MATEGYRLKMEMNLNEDTLDWAAQMSRALMPFFDNAIIMNETGYILVEKCLDKDAPSPVWKTYARWEVGAGLVEGDISDVDWGGSRIV